MQETSKILRTDTVALFERLREGNIPLQEVLTGAHDNLNSLSARSSPAWPTVSAMNDVTSAQRRCDVRWKTSSRSSTQRRQGRWKISARCRPSSILTKLLEAAGRGRAKQPQHHHLARRAQGDAGIAGHHHRSQDRRDSISGLSRFTGLFDESLAAAEERTATSRAWWRKPRAQALRRSAGSSRRSVPRAENERQQTLDAMNELYQQSTQKPTRCSRTSTEKFPPRWCRP